MSTRTHEDQIDDFARRIARALRLRTSRGELPGPPAGRIHRALVAAAHGREKQLYERLDQIRQEIYSPTRRDYYTCLILLDKLWLLEPDTQAETDVVRILRESYTLCTRPHDKETLREEVLNRQRSSFPIIRRVASQIRDGERVEPEEVRMLADPRTFPEIRMAIAGRLVWHRQNDYIPPLLEYLVWACRCDDRAEQRSADKMFRRLSDFGLESMLPPLFRAYVRHFDELDVRGQLMRALSSFGDPLVPQLEQIYRSQRMQERKPTARLLGQMITFGSASATKALCDIVIEVGGTDIEFAAEQLYKAARELADRGMEFAHGVSLKDYFDEAVRRLEAQPGPIPQRLARQLTALSWDAGLTAELLERCLAGDASPEELQRLRRSGARGFELLSSAIQDRSRTIKARVRALDLVWQLQGQSRREASRDLLWRVYCEETEVHLRVAALRSYARTDAELTQEQRERLYRDYRNGGADLRDVILRNWNRMFPDVPTPNI